jgi:energy-coupling factor transporter ATP-binding protein EcfA2
MSVPFLEARGLRHTYLADTPLACESLKGTELAVGQGEVVALVGASGSGKSTLLQHMNGLLSPAHGAVFFMGKNLRDKTTDLTAVRRRIGMVFQRPELQLFEQYAGDDVAYGPRLAGLAGRELGERVRWAMGLVGLDFHAFKDRLTVSLSGGERRKAALAGVLAMKPEGLLLDEPTAGLDPVSHAELVRLLGKLAADGMTMVIATHDMEDAAALAGKIAVMSDGRVVFTGEPREVFADAGRLEGFSLQPPASVSILAGLRESGWDVPAYAASAGEAVDAIRAALDAGRAR